MANLGKNNRLKGSLGNLVFRELNGKTIVQRKPKKNTVKQTRPTQLAAVDFGSASTTAKKIRIGVKTYSRDLGDAQSFCRLRTRVQLAARTDNSAPSGARKLWEGNPALLEGFEYNLHSPYERYVPGIAPELSLVNQQLQVSVEAFSPKQALTWPKGASKAKLCFWMAVHRPEDDLSIQEALFSVEVTPDQDLIAESHFTSEAIPENCWVFLWTGIVYYSYNAVFDWESMNHKKLQPLRLWKVLQA